MMDFTLHRDGDIVVTETGDIEITQSIRQAVMIRLRWLFSEWRLGPDYGFRWLEDSLIKNPDIPRIKGLIRSEIMRVDGVTGAQVDDVRYDAGKRTATFRFACTVGEETFREEVTLYG